MKDITSLNVSDVRSLLHLLGEITELRRDRIAWRRHTLAQLCAMTDAVCGTAAIGGSSSPDVPPHISLVVEHGFPASPARDALLQSIFDNMYGDPFREPFTRQIHAHIGHVVTFRREDLVPDRLWYNHPYVSEIRRPAGVDHMVASATSAVVPGIAMILTLYRRWGDKTRFSPRDRTLLGLVNDALTPFYRAEHNGGVTDPQLSPRLRQTLAYLLAGRNERAIADAMKLSTHTVHDYIKQVYQHHGVTTRGELLAKFIT